MARIRTIKPEFFSSERIALLSIPARLTFVGMWTEADDYGAVVDNHRLLKGHLWPHDDDITATDVSLHVQQMVDAGLVRRYEHEGRRLLWINGFADNQRVNRPTPGRRLPPPPWAPADAFSESSVSPHGALTEDSPQERKGRERKGSSSARARAREAQPATHPNDDDDENFDPRAEHALALLADHLAARHARDDRAGYRHAVLADNDRRHALEELAAAHPNADPAWLLREHLGQPHPTAKCPNCGSRAHAAEDCPIP